MTTQQQRLRYRLHYKLRKYGCRIQTGKKLIVKHSAVTTPIVAKYLKQLCEMGYGIQNPIFEEEHFINS